MGSSLLEDHRDINSGFVISNEFIPGKIFFIRQYGQASSSFSRSRMIDEYSPPHTEQIHNARCHEFCIWSVYDKAEENCAI